MYRWDRLIEFAQVYHHSADVRVVSPVRSPVFTKSLGNVVQTHELRSVRPRSGSWELDVSQGRMTSPLTLVPTQGNRFRSVYWFSSESYPFSMTSCTHAPPLKTTNKTLDGCRTDTCIFSDFFKHDSHVFMILIITNGVSQLIIPRHSITVIIVNHVTHRGPVTRHAW